MKKAIIAAALLLSFCVGGLAGSFITGQRNLEARRQAGQTMISFSIDKIEELRDGYQADTMEALISNVYAATQYADDSDLSAALHELWNALIFDGENITGKEDDLIRALQDADPNVIKGVAHSIRSVH